MSQSDIELPWIEEPVDVPEAVELVAHAGYHDEAVLEEMRERIERLETWIGALTDGTSVACPACNNAEQVFTVGVGAAVLANEGNLTDANAEALNVESHVCLECQEAFTPDIDDNAQ